MMKRILVTGATGFIGRYVSEYLTSFNGCTVIMTGRKKATDFLPVPLILYNTIHEWSDACYIPFDMDDYDKAINYFEFFGRPDVVIHFAWNGSRDYNSDSQFNDNVTQQYKFLGNLISNGLPQLVVAGTCFEYGNRAGCLSETIKTDDKNTTVYGISKNVLRLLLEKLQVTHPYVLKWLRLFYTYGEGQHPDCLIPQLQKALTEKKDSFDITNGYVLRDYLPVETMAKYIVRITFQDKVNGIINCCSGAPVSVVQLINNYLTLHGRNIRLNFLSNNSANNPLSFWGNTHKLKSCLL